MLVGICRSALPLFPEGSKESRCIVYQDFQSENRIINAYIPCRWIANPPERKNR